MSPEGEIVQLEKRFLRGRLSQDPIPYKPQKYVKCELSCVLIDVYQNLNLAILAPSSG